jgi:uncharacterized membrane protein
MFFRKKHFFNEQERKGIVQAIAEAEAMTSGEIRVHVEPKCKGDVLLRAAFVFHKLEMHKSTHANRVLIYIAHDDRKFAILGDKGINAVVPANFWDNIKEGMREYFKKGQFYEGTVFAIREAGQHLKVYFPHTGEQKNELPNETGEG